MTAPAPPVAPPPVTDDGDDEPVIFVSAHIEFDGVSYIGARHLPVITASPADVADALIGAATAVAANHGGPLAAILADRLSVTGCPGLTASDVEARLADHDRTCTAEHQYVMQLPSGEQLPAALVRDVLLMCGHP